MEKLRIGERIILAEREQASTQTELDFCLDVKRGKIKPRQQFAYLLERAVFPGYKFDEDEQWYYENHYADKMSKLDYINQQREKIREVAIDNYKREVAKYSNIDSKIRRLKAEVFRNARIIKAAKKKYYISYFIAKNISCRMNKPSFVFSATVGDALVNGLNDGINRRKSFFRSQIDILKEMMQNGESKANKSP